MLPTLTYVYGTAMSSLAATGVRRCALHVSSEGLPAWIQSLQCQMTHPGAHTQEVAPVDPTAVVVLPRPQGVQESVEPPVL
jgi:hypothetical protein